jgi:hypothetical protein
MITYGELLRRCRKDLSKDMQRTRDLIEQSKKNLTKTLMKGKDYHKQLGGEMVRPALHFKRSVEMHHDTLTQYLRMLEYMTDNYHEPLPEIEYVGPNIDRGFLANNTMRENVVEVSVRVDKSLSLFMFRVDLATIFDKRSSIIRRAALIKTASEGTSPMPWVFVVKLAIIYQLGTYFRSLRSIKVVNFLRNLQGRKIFINGNSAHRFIASSVYASKVHPEKRRQKKPDYLVTFDSPTLVSTMTIKRGWNYFTDADKYHLWAAMPGRKVFKHVASLAEVVPGLTKEK